MTRKIVHTKFYKNDYAIASYEKYKKCLEELFMPEDEKEELADAFDEEEEVTLSRLKARSMGWKGK